MTAEIRPTRPEDVAPLCSFLTERFGRPWTPEEHAWKYEALPGEARSLVTVGAEGGQILAHAGALCLPARLWDRDAGIWQLVDFAGVPQGRGLRPALVELGRRLLADLPRPGDAPWIFGFPSERHFRLGERVFGYQPLAEIVELGREIPAEPAPADARILAARDSCGDWAESIWDACGACGVRRSAAFLNWRYHARPHRYYRFYRLAVLGGEGLAVFAFVGEEAWAAELWLPPGNGWHPALLAVAADLRAAGLRRWRFWETPVLAGLGLQPTGERRFIGCRGAAAAGFTYAMGDWDLA